jgi:hypothetical protein
MSRRTRFATAFFVALAATAWSLAGQPATETGQVCSNPQSPRRLAGYQNTPTFSISRAAPDSGDSLSYLRLADHRSFLLKRCGQHYHCQVENVQPQCGQAPSAGTCGSPAPGAWVEIHTVYSTQVGTGCDPEKLDCCQSLKEGDPVLVMAYHARVTAEGPPLQPIPLPWGYETARWSGSTTGEEKPSQPCKPPAQWNFVLGCGFTVSKAQLGLFHHLDQARGLQSQLSHDLVRQPAQ